MTAAAWQWQHGSGFSMTVATVAVATEWQHGVAPNLSISMIFSRLEGSSSGLVTRFSTASTTPSPVWIPTTAIFIVKYSKNSEKSGKNTIKYDKNR
jgi:hypothetical protein